MSKVEKFNFSIHLKEIVGNELKQHGFKVKGTRLIRNRIDFIDEIYFQRSQFNAFDDNIFFLELTVSSLEGCRFASIRLDNANKLNVPSFFSEYLSDTEEKSGLNYDKLNDKEKREFDKWYDSRCWKYSNEEELIKLFKDSSDLLLLKGLHYFDAITKLFENKSIFDEDLRKVALKLNWKINNEFESIITSS